MLILYYRYMKVSYGFHFSKVRKNMTYTVEICLLTFLVLKYLILVFFVYSILIWEQVLDYIYVR